MDGSEAVERIRSHHDRTLGHSPTNRVGYCAEPDGISATYCETGILLAALPLAAAPEPPTPDADAAWRDGWNAAIRWVEREPLADKRVRADTCPTCGGTVLAPESLMGHVRSAHSDRILPNGEYMDALRAAPEPPTDAEAALADDLRRRYNDVVSRLDEPKMGNPKYGIDRRHIEFDLRRVALDAILLAEAALRAAPEPGLRAVLAEARRRIMAADDAVQLAPWDARYRSGYGVASAVAVAHLDRAALAARTPTEDPDER